MKSYSSKVIVAGSRTITDKDFIFQKLDHLLRNLHNIEIVSGTAQGPDRIGELYAIHRNLGLIRFPADWDTYGKSAGYIRNRQMAEYATHLVAFHNGYSKGTKHMINIARELNLEVRVVYE